MKNSNVQYPPQFGKYAVKVKNGRGWNAYKTARLQISVGQEYHEGDKFEATINWAKHRFEKTIICVNDTLQRFNFSYKTNMDTSQALFVSESEGAAWVERNKRYIEQLPNFELYRWENWRSHPAYAAEYEYVTNLYQKDNLVKDLVLQNVLDFWKRRERKADMSGDYHFDTFKKASIEYLLEETAVFFLMFKKERAVDIYPGSTLLPCVLAKQYCSGQELYELGERAFTRIDFSRTQSAANENQSSEK